MNWGDRLKSERARLGISQRKLCEMTGISQPSQVSYEKSAGNPTGNYWQFLAGIGFDVQYIFSGNKSSGINNLPVKSVPVEHVTVAQLEDTLEMIQLEAQRAQSMVQALLTKKGKEK